MKSFFTLLLLLALLDVSKAQNWVSRELAKHEEIVNHVTISSDGTWAASASDDNKVKIYSLPDGKLIKEFVAHSVGVTDVAFSIDKTLLFTSGKDRLIRVWNVGTWKREKDIEAHDLQINALELSPDGQFLFSCSDDLTIKQWKLEDYSLVKTFKGHNQRILSINISGDGKKMVSTSGDKISKTTHNLIVWDLQTGQPVYQLETEEYAIQDARFNAEGTWIAYGGNFTDVRIIQATTGKLMAQKTVTQYGINSVIIRGITTYSAQTFSGAWSKWKIGTDVISHPSHNGNINSIEMTPKGDLIITCGADYTVRLWTKK